MESREGQSAQLVYTLDDEGLFWLYLGKKGTREMNLRDEFAARIMAGICAGDWKFDTSTKSWDEVAVARAYEIADAMLKEREISNV